MLRDNLDRIVNAIYEDLGKPKQEAIAYVIACGDCNYTAEYS